MSGIDSSIDAGEVAKFERMAAEWWDPTGKFKPLHVMNPVRLDYCAARIAERFKDKRDYLFLGRGANYPTALEGALKLKEISYIHAEAYATGEMKHGPIALIDADMPVVAVATASALYDKTVSNLQEVRARDGIVIALATAGDTRIAAHADEVIYLPATLELVSPIINVVALQLLAYETAARLGRDVDQPRNLAKSVTVE